MAPVMSNNEKGTQIHGLSIAAVSGILGIAVGLSVLLGIVTTRAADKGSVMKSVQILEADSVSQKLINVDREKRVTTLESKCIEGQTKDAAQDNHLEKIDNALAQISVALAVQAEQLRTQAEILKRIDKKMP
jgi:hypothetical protein